MPKKTLSLCGVVFSSAALLFGASVAHATTITYTATGTGGDGAESASATFTTSANTVMLSLSSLINNPTADGQEVSGIFFTLSNTPTDDTLTSATGTLISIAPGGAVTPAGTNILHFGTSLTNSTVCLQTAGTCAVGGQPYDLIIGNGPYTNANPSITGKNPQVQNTANFVLTLPGVTAGTTITGVTFEFGTGPSSLPGVPTPPSVVPEPSSLILLGTGIFSAAGMLRRRLSSKA